MEHFVKTDLVLLRRRLSKIRLHFLQISAMPACLPACMGKRSGLHEPTVEAYFRPRKTYLHLELKGTELHSHQGCQISNVNPQLIVQIHQCFHSIYESFLQSMPLSLSFLMQPTFGPFPFILLLSAVTAAVGSS